MIARMARSLFASGITVGLVMVPLSLPTLAQTTDATPTAESWYRAQGEEDDQAQELLDELCNLGLPLPACTLVDPPADLPSPYPEGTLHVSAASGTPETMTFLELGEPAGVGDRFTGGTLVLPVTEGTTAPEQARFQACLTFGRVIDGVDGGDVSAAPPVDCSASSPAEWVPDDEAAVSSDPLGNGVRGSFTVDLAPLAERWGIGAPAVALVPVDDLDDGDTWHVSFNRRDRGDEHEPITFTLVRGAGDTGTGVDAGLEPDEPAAAPGPAPAVPMAPPGPVGGMAPVIPGPSDVPAPAVAPEEPAGEAAPVSGGDVVAGGPLVASFPVGVIYPIAYAVPLVALVLGALVTSSLATPVRLDPDEG